MKIAIKANPDRGKEIISLLKSLGGINKKDWKGNGEYDAYYIDKNNIIQYDFPPKDYKLYTLEEFEKEFPFKTGDYVTIVSGILYKIVALEYYEGILSYRLTNGFYYDSKALKPYKEMKEERNITLTLDKAKEWYKKGGELKEIALQAFSEKELNPLPRSWEEFCDNYPVKESEAMIGCDASIINCRGIEGNRSYKFKDIMPSKQSAEAHLAMMQLEQLRDCWRQGNIPQEFKYKIKKVTNKYTVIFGEVDGFLSFCDKQTAAEFLECFRDLIEKAGDLI